MTAWPRTIRYQDVADTAFPENLVRFRLYTNYHSFIARAEVRVFDAEQSVRDTPLAVIAMNDDGTAQWQPDFESYLRPGEKAEIPGAGVRQGGGLRRDHGPAAVGGRPARSAVVQANPGKELLAGYGESRIATRNIPLHGGTVQAHGSAIPAGHSVWLAGYAVPVDEKGNFVGEEILPEGMQTVEVAVLDQAGNGELFLRDLELKKSDWFTVGIADLTLSANKTDGPAKLLAPDNRSTAMASMLQGRLAFYTKGKFGNGWGLTASADTREGPLDEIFTNFLDKSPEALFRRIDPDYHYPTFGDDSTVAEDAPTSGKFYLKLNKEQNYALWGNFKVGYTDNYLAHVDRGLYGANLHYQTRSATGFGEQRFLADGFAADPGTVPGRDEFRGTGGSLYYLRRQDILEGSERVRIEVRDKDSGHGAERQEPGPGARLRHRLPAGAHPARPSPWPIRPTTTCWCRATRAAAIPSTWWSATNSPPASTTWTPWRRGGRVQYWLNDHVKLGVTASRDEDAGSETNLDGADLTLRKSAASWLRLEAGRSKGPGVLTTTSIDGGFNDAPAVSPDGSDERGLGVPRRRQPRPAGLLRRRAGPAHLLPAAARCGLFGPGPGHRPGPDPVRRHGGTSLHRAPEPAGQGGLQHQREGLETEAGELDLDYRAGEHWTVSSGRAPRPPQGQFARGSPDPGRGGPHRRGGPAALRFPRELDRLRLRSRGPSRRPATARATPASAAAAVTGSPTASR